jgi:outer membrane lipoprotein-sorting protein
VSGQTLSPQNSDGKDGRSIMKQRAKLSRRMRWALPAGIVATVGGVLTTSMISLAQPPPLPPRTPAQLLTALAANPSAPALSGTVVETASLGLPALPSLVGPISLSSFLAGSHVIKVWYADPTHYRIAVPQTDSESDLIRSGSNAWLWGSSVNMVEHMALPAGGQASPAMSLPLTPQQAADQVLARVGPTTTVGVDNNVTVAGEAAYQLVLAPKDSGSLIGQVRVAIDGRHNVPLRVQVFARHATSPTIQVGFSSISFGQPATQNFAFTPPAGAAVVRQSPGFSGKAAVTAWGNDLASGSKVIGSNWLTVLDLPESALTGSAPSGGSASSSPKPTGLIGSSSTSAGPAAGGSGMAALGVDTGSIFNAFVKSAERVSGSWGSGRLMQTSLVSMLVTSNGRVLVGAVTPNVLYQAAAHAGQAPTAQRHHAAVPATSK